MKKRKHQRLLLPLMCIALFIGLITHAFISFENRFVSMELERKHQELQKTAQVKAEAVTKKYSNMLDSLHALAESIQQMDHTNEHDLATHLNLLAKVGYFDAVGLSNAQGEGFDNLLRRVNISSRRYFKEAIKNHISISDVLQSTVEHDKKVQVLAVSIINQNDTASGIVFGVINIDNMGILMENETGSDIYTQIVDSKGNYITPSNTKDSLISHKNVWDDFNDFVIIDRKFEDIKSDFRQGLSNGFEFRKGNEERISYYMPLGLKGYYVFSTINNKYIDDWTNQINQTALIMVIEMGFGFFILLLGLYLYNRKVNEQLRQFHAQTQSNAMMMEIAIQQSNQFVFEYNIANHTLYKKAGVNNPLFDGDEFTNMPYSILEKNVLAEDSTAAFFEAFTEIAHTDSLMKIVNVNFEGDSYWYKIIIKNIYDDANVIINTVGNVEDITEKKVQEELLEEGAKEKVALQELALRDGLTGLYNAMAFKTKVQDFLTSSRSRDGKHLFVLMDLDNFKQINDTFGHNYGDSVLKDVANILQSKFRKDDIIARIGGDEFGIFLINATSVDVMIPAFNELLSKLSKTYTVDGQSVSISASFGIVEAPTYSNDYLELYKKSDLMLYEVKRAHKNGFKVFK